jgi:hypothetical protein
LPAVATPEGRLARADELVEQLKGALVESIGRLEPTVGERWATLGRRVGELRDEIDPRDYDKDQLVELFDALWDIRSLVEEDPSDLDAADQLLLRLERIRHVVRDALDEHVAGFADDTSLVLRDLERHLPRTPDRVLAELIGVDRRTLSRWRKQRKPPPRRLRTVARIVAVLARNWTEEGIVAWFHRARRELEGRRPLTLLADPANDEALLDAARSGRSQYAT